MEVGNQGDDEENERKLLAGSSSEENDADENQMIESESEDEHESTKDKIEDDKEEDEEDDDDDEDEAEVRMLEASLTENPYDYTTHVTLIGKLHDMGELERLRAARENMSAKYPLSSELWLAWLRDEIKLATTPEQKAAVEILCERAVIDYLCKHYHCFTYS